MPHHEGKLSMQAGLKVYKAKSVENVASNRLLLTTLHLTPHNSANAHCAHKFNNAGDCSFRAPTMTRMLSAKASEEHMPFYALGINVAVQVGGELKGILSQDEIKVSRRQQRGSCSGASASRLGRWVA